MMCDFGVSAQSLTQKTENPEERNL